MKKAASFHFECKLESFSRTPRGVYLKLQLNPLDVPTELASAPAGQRYVIALSELGDFDEDKGEGDRAVQLAGILCRTDAFRRFLREVHGAKLCRDEDETALVLRRLIGVESRSDLRHDAKARDALQRIKSDYDTYLNSQGTL